jgi:hypothetical protein|tara:strand:+ start:471 stop:599 length:129 start_codon:yes stop_codon:yes gene_type:complete
MPSVKILCKKALGNRSENYLKKRLGGGFPIWYFGGAVETKTA